MKKNSAEKMNITNQTGISLSLPNKVKGLTLAEQITSDLPTISKMGVEGLELFARWINNLQIDAGVKNQMSTDQIKECATFMSERYWHWKVSDLIECRKRILLGDYGQFYERLSIPILFEMLSKYEEFRDGELVRFHQNKSKAIRSDLKALNPPEGEIVNVNEIMENLVLRISETANKNNWAEIIRERDGKMREFKDIDFDKLLEKELITKEQYKKLKGN